MKLLSPLTDFERRFTVTSMASAQINMLDKAEAMRLYRDDLAKKRVAAAEKKKQAAEKSKENAHTALEHVQLLPESSPLRKRQKRDFTVDRGKRTKSSSKEKSVATALELDSSMVLL